MFCVYVTINVKAEFVDQFMAACAGNHHGTVQEPGALRFDVLRDSTDPQRFYLYEVYTDEAAFLAHQQTAHYALWRDSVAPWMASPRSAIKSQSLYPAPYA